MTEVKLEPFDAKHLAAVIKLERELFPQDAWSDDTFYSEIAGIGKTRKYWVALAGEEVVGYCGIYFLPPDCDIQTIAVAKSHWRQGIGRLMMRQMLGTAASLGCKHMMLEVRTDNQAAIELYESFGFVGIGGRANYYGPGLDCLVMRNSALNRSPHA